MAATAEAEEQRDDQVFVWRRGELIRMGFNRRQATKMAEVQDVCHAAEKLLEAGCPRELVFDLVT